MSRRVASSNVVAPATNEVHSNQLSLDEQTLDDLVRRMGMDSVKWRSQRAWLEDPDVHALAEARLMDLSPVRRDLQEAIEGLVALARASVRLGPLGWTVAGDRLVNGTYTKAVALIDADEDQSAIDEVMTTAWSNRVTLRGTYGPILWLYGPDDNSIDLMIGRIALLDQALEHHLRGEYAAAVLIVLSQIDGITLDATNNKHGCFIKANGLPLEDSATIAGLPGNLSAARKVIAKDMWQTSMDGRLERHWIMHGRELRTERRSTLARPSAYSDQ